MAGFGIVYWADHQQKVVPISEDVYEHIFNAVKIDKAQLDIEEKYQILLSNYVEFEEDSLRFTLKLALYTSDVWKELDDAQALINRRILNYLSTARMYLDQIPHDLLHASRNPESARSIFSNMLKSHYDNSLGYRVCETLRNYTQHNGLPIHGIHHGWNRAAGESIAKVKTGIKLNLRRLESDKKIKGKILAELRKIAEEHDLKRFLREYMNCFGDIHLEIRKYLSEDSNWAINEITQIRESAYSNVNAERGYDVSLVSINDDDTWEKIAVITLHRYERRKHLQSKSRLSPKMVNIQISSE